MTDSKTSYKKDMTALHKQIKCLLIRFDTNQSELAENLGVSPTYLSWILTGKRETPRWFVPCLIEKFTLTGKQVQNIKNAISGEGEIDFSAWL